uniref:Fmp27_GFWDK domain-containing protein n=2 Tax=Caenorhabditis tropicalis TaxID=1561998 RepID=A0A1I7UK14_9PELO
MIVFGECVSFDEYDTMFLVLNVETRIFNTVSFDGLLLEEVEDFPEFDVKKTKLVLIREGLLLLTGELEPGNYGSSVLIEFNPELFIRTEPLPWRWKLVETIGRWWRPKNQVNEDEDVENCALPNFNFYQIADVRNSGIVRLVSMGKIRTADQTNRSPITEKYKAVQALYREFCRQLKCHLETEFQRRYVEKSCAVFQYQNIKCRIDGCFIRGPIKRSRNAHRFKVSVKIGSAYSNPNMPNFDDFDKWELRVSIRAVVNQLHSKYYNIGRMDQLAPRVPMRNSTLKRLSVYVADIDSNVAFENFNELRWTCQPTQYQAPVETREFALVGAHHDVIMHAGTVRFNETMRRMGQTTLMTPIANV